MPPMVEGVEPAVNPAACPVEPPEFAVVEVVDRSVFRVRSEHLVRLHAFRHVIETDLAESHCRDVGRAAQLRLNRVRDLPDGAIENVGQDPAPHRGGTAAAHDGDRVPGAAEELLRRAEDPARVERDPLQHGPHEVGPGVFQRQVVNPCTDAPVFDGRDSRVVMGRL